MSLVILTTRKTVGPFDIKERKPKPIGATKYVIFKGDYQVKDFGRYSAAIRWAKGQLPREVPHVVIVESGELVVSNMPVRYTLVDGPYRRTADALVDPEQFAICTTPK